MQTQGKTIGKYADERDVERCDCGPNSIVRNRYFFSMLLEPQDMAQDQAFHLGNVRRHNAALHGFGTVCGLRVERTPCHEEVRVKAGIAIDCLGREIRLEEDIKLDLSPAIAQAVKKRAAKPRRDAEAYAAPEAREQDRPYDDDSEDDHCRDPIDVYVTLCYREMDERPVQALGGPETCCAPGCQNSRTRSGWCLEVSDEPPRIPRRIQHLMDDLGKCDTEEIEDWVCDWITQDCWQCELDPCNEHHQCLGLARVRVVPGGAVVDVDNCCIRPLVLPTVLLAGLARFAIEGKGGAR
jgi:hypothetical protein